jgi:cyanophycin synthetase
VLSRHLADGGRAVYLRGRTITLAQGARETPLLDVAEVPATLGGKIGFQISNALAAAAACWGAGCPTDAICLGLRSFQPDDQTAPGRFNLFTVGQAQVILDYGHNPQALRAIQDAVRALAPRCAAAVVAAPGDRRDEDIRELARICAETFDEIIIREDDDLRGREPGEVAQLIAEVIHTANPALPVRIIRDEREAINTGLVELRPGELLVTFVDHVQAGIDQIRAYAAEVAAHGTGAAPAPPVPPPHPSGGTADNEQVPPADTALAGNLNVSLDHPHSAAV